MRVKYWKSKHQTFFQILWSKKICNEQNSKMCALSDVKRALHQ